MFCNSIQIKIQKREREKEWERKREKHGKAISAILWKDLY